MRPGKLSRRDRKPFRSELPEHTIVMKEIHGQLVPVRVFPLPKWHPAEQQIGVPKGGRSAGGLSQVVDDHKDSKK